MNKGCPELIEAHHLFGVPYDRIEVVVRLMIDRARAGFHLNDGASLAHLGYPDMRVPIARCTIPIGPTSTWTPWTSPPSGPWPSAPDEDAFPCLRIARGRRGGRHDAMRDERRERGWPWARSSPAASRSTRSPG